MATITSTATGNWSVGATWVGGVKPASGDDAVIAAGHTVTKDDAAGADDCASLTINATGALAIGSNGIKIGGAITNNGTVTGGANGGLEINANSTGGDGVWTLTGTSGNVFTVTGTSLVQFRLHGTNGAGASQIEYVLFTGLTFVQVYAWSAEDYFKNCAFEDGTNGISTAGSDQGVIRLEDCTFDNLTGTAIPLANTMEVYMTNCISAGSNPVTNDFVNNSSKGGGIVRAHNCVFGATTYMGRVASRRNWIVFSQGHQGVEGDWHITMYGGEILKSTASKKSGDYGIEMTPGAYCAALDPIFVDIPIPVDSGDVLTGPTLPYYNATADLGLSAAADRLVFELDPGNEWGLNEVIDASDLADPYLADPWPVATFSSGTAGGTAKKGSVILRVWLKRYIASAVVYLADLAY